ncbi:MAG: MBL fold metallo-hydrolase [Pseudolabrys sp.]|nr:MBL fold metallo-hydrolase [Pseudolabrys sp.]MBV9260183.1 MBL fold metallo-hydrolase [Pseudolabrys sp.]
MAADMKGPLRPTLYRFKLGNFEMMNMLDSFAQRDGLAAVHGGGSAPGAVEELAKMNNIDPSKFEHPFVPALVNTGNEIILFDTGNGTLSKDVEALKGRVPEGHLVERLAQAGYKPEDIDIVCFTHCHPDHIGANFTNGKPTFPNARYVISAAEFDYWKKGENISDARKPTKAQFDRIMAPLADKCTFIKPGNDVVTGIRAVDCSGHSAGLTGYHIESEGKRVLMFADSFLHYVCGIQHPEWTIGFDDNQQKAVENRKRLLAMTSSEKLMVMGFHMPFPSIGWIDKRADGRHQWVAASYQMNM